MSRGQVIDKAQGMANPQVLADDRLRAVLTPMYVNVGLLTGTIGTILNRAVTVQDLVDLGIVVQTNGRLFVPGADAPGFNQYEEQSDNTSTSSNFEMDCTDHLTGDPVHVIVENGKCRKVV